MIRLPEGRHATNVFEFDDGHRRVVYTARIIVVYSIIQ